MIRRVALLVVIFILWLSASALAAEPGNGVIEGRLVNGTAGGGSVADQDVTLKIYLDNAEVDSASARTDAQGHFVFDGLSTEAGYSYEASLFFQKAEYYSEWLIFDEGETNKSVEVAVYDSTTNVEVVKVAMSHTVIDVGEDSLKIKEYFFFVNETDRTYIGSEPAAADETRETLRFSLPAGATEMQITLGLMECCITGSEDGFVDTMPVLPGSREVAYSYMVEHNSGKYTFSPNVNYPTTRYDLLYQGEVIEVTGGQIAGDEPMDINGTQYNHLSGSDLAPGDALSVTLSGLPGAGPGAIMWTVLVLAVLVLGTGLFALLRRKRLQPVSLEESPDLIRKNLLVELARLDDDFEGGRIPEDVYRRLRVEKKAQLVELIEGRVGESDNS